MFVDLTSHLVCWLYFPKQGSDTLSSEVTYLLTVPVTTSNLRCASYQNKEATINLARFYTFRAYDLFDHNIPFYMMTLCHF